MDFSTALRKVLTEYPVESKTGLAKNPLAEFLHRGLPGILSQTLSSNDQLQIVGSAGKGQWAQVPWVALMNPGMAKSPKRGYYLVYLFRHDCTGVYLSLNQGVESVLEELGATEALGELRVRASLLSSQPAFSRFNEDTQIDLRASVWHARAYEVGSIRATFYDLKSWPEISAFHHDLDTFVSWYDKLAAIPSMAQIFDSQEDDEKDIGREDLRFFRIHKRLERNQRLALQAKRAQGYKCRACGFDFFTTYGDIGRHYVEAHHLTPLSQLAGKIVSLDPKNDFVVLCANCHRMIHRSQFVHDVEAFKLAHLPVIADQKTRRPPKNV